MRIRIPAAFLVIVIASIFLSGCLISHRSHTSVSSPYSSMSRTKLDSIEPGVTTKDWIIDTFGDPTREKHLQDGEEILIYENKEKTSHHFSILLIFSTHSTEEQKKTLSFRVKDGVVKSYWLD
ncbi:hypothetical protein ACFL1N_09315 [Thermodesulfobacteriota bacterium]